MSNGHDQKKRDARQIKGAALGLIRQTSFKDISGAALVTFGGLRLKQPCGVDMFLVVLSESSIMINLPCEYFVWSVCTFCSVTGQD